MYGQNVESLKEEMKERRNDMLNALLLQVSINGPEVNHNSSKGMVS